MTRDGRTLDHRTLETIRTMAVARVREGERPSEVIASYGFHRCTIYRWLKTASGRGHGLKALASRPATGRPRTLTAAQERQVFRWINGKNPSQYGFDFGLWTRQIVRELIAQRFGVRLSLASIGAVLARQGLTPQKPLQRAYQRDPVAIARWQRETYPAIVRRAKRDKAEIYLLGRIRFPRRCGAGPDLGSQGADPGGISPRSAPEYARRLGDQCQGGVLVRYLCGRAHGRAVRDPARRMVRSQGKPLHLILDGLPAHKIKAVTHYVTGLHGKLTLHYLPGYAPDLNPDELVWSYAKRTGVARRPLQQGESLEGRVTTQLIEIGRRPALVRSFFQHPSVAYISDY